MAYGNWGAFVYRDGERMADWEDQTPYKEREYQAGYHQAFGISNLSAALAAPEGTIPESAKLDRATEHGPHHAVLGEKDVRLCGYKNYPKLFVNGESVDLGQYVTEGRDEWEYEGKTYVDGSRWEGELEGGYRFEVQKDMDTENRIDLTLIEPDGVVWTARCGYEYGAGHEW